ncbi:hypothetical protein [uncultured Treponema sp.]|uniref:hypothetical protein n=1 Tax=uncultured Treponema sp. TaxID=162155 RepID=UPI0025D3E7A2|nr:hypothetical protein [uncultured Treponema sp.]
MANLFDIFLIIYYIFFAGLFVLAGIVYSMLKNLSEKISEKDFNKTELNFEIYKNPESFIMHSYPNFPLSALVKILPGTFVGLGILGTFIGFSNGISEMSFSENWIFSLQVLTPRLLLQLSVLFYLSFLE